MRYNKEYFDSQGIKISMVTDDDFKNYLVIEQPGGYITRNYIRPNLVEDIKHDSYRHDSFSALKKLDNMIHQSIMEYRKKKLLRLSEKS